MEKKYLLATLIDKKKNVNVTDITKIYTGLVFISCATVYYTKMCNYFFN